MLKCRWIILALIVLSWPAMAAAEGNELTVFGGYRFSEGFDAWDWYHWNPNYRELDVEPDLNYGLIYSWAVSKRFRLELMWDHQTADLYERGGIFGQDLELGDIDIDYYHVGVVFQWPLQKIQPFVVQSLGATRLAPDATGYFGETYFSLGLGGGVKIPVSEHFGVRLEGRLYTTVLDNDRDWCHDHGCWGWNDDEWDVFVQNELRFGFMWTF